MAEPDFRALCAKLLQGLDENRHEEVRYPGHLRLVMADARAALGRSSPAPTRDELNGALGPGPTVEEVAAAAEQLAQPGALGTWRQLVVRAEEVAAAAKRLDDAQRIQRLRQALCETISACGGLAAELATEKASDDFLCQAPLEVRIQLAKLRYGNKLYPW
jgi:hypothetical protein